MDLAIAIAEVNLSSTPDLGGLGMGDDEHQFLFDYIQFLIQQHIADIGFSDCLIDWYDREMVPRFIAPLTSRGREVVNYISTLQDKFDAEGKLSAHDPHIRVAQEGLIQMVFVPSSYARFPLVSEFQNLIKP